MKGDVDFAAAEPIVAAITPVPGGVGTVTTSVLVKHVIQAAQRTLKYRNIFRQFVAEFVIVIFEKP